MLRVMYYVSIYNTYSDNNVENFMRVTILCESESTVTAFAKFRGVSGLIPLNICLNKANSYAMSYMDKTAHKAVNGPLLGITIGLSSKPSAKLRLSVIMIKSAPRALTSSAVVLI